MYNFFKIAIVAVFLSLLVGSIVLAPERVPEAHTDADEWCFYANYIDMETYRATNRPKHVRIELNGDRVTVYVQCGSLLGRDTLETEVH